jgi:hypothetical protein
MNHRQHCSAASWLPMNAIEMYQHRRPYHSWWDIGSSKTFPHQNIAHHHNLSPSSIEDIW